MLQQDSPTIKISSKQSQPLVHQLDQISAKGQNTKTVILILIVIFSGMFSGFYLSRLRQSSGVVPTALKTGNAGTAKVVGSQDTKSFPDSTEGQLEAGGINGEGTHKLIRAGGESQTVYLTSSVLDLNQFVGKNVRVWGQTFAAQRAGWLMDVGKVEVL